MKIIHGKSFILKVVSASCDAVKVEKSASHFAWKTQRVYVISVCRNILCMLYTQSSAGV